jgi:hypothetical protein
MPRVKLTPMTRFALYFLRFYLVFLVLLLGVRFIRVFRAGNAHPGLGNASRS